MKIFELSGIGRSGRPAGEGERPSEPPAVSQMPAAGRGSMAEIGRMLREIPFTPQGSRLFSVASAGRPDLSKFSQRLRGGGDDVYPYPEGFEKVTFQSLDGTPLVGVMGLHRDGRRRPGAVFCHGFLGSKNKPYVVEAALEAFNEWDYNVFALDLRNFGESGKLSHSPTTGGWKEGQDVLAACRLLGQREEVTSVAAVGYSLGAGAVMNAARQCERYPYITGGALGWSGYASMEQMTERISSRPPLDDPFFPVYALFLFLSEIKRLELRRQLGEEGDAYAGIRPFSARYRDYVREIAAPHYGLSEEKIYALSSPREFIAEVRVPLMLVHAQDDPVCPMREIEELKEAAEGNPNVDIWVLPTGWHCAFQGFDRRWYHAVMRGYLDYWACRPEAATFVRAGRGSGGEAQRRETA